LNIRIVPGGNADEYPTYEHTKAKAKLKLKAIFELKEEF